jgi:hypothetical protein
MWRTTLIAATTVLWSSIGGAQTPASPPQTGRTAAEASPAADGLKELDAMTFACPRAALDAAAREAAKVHAQGTYQFAFFRIFNESHHAQYEIHFQSNYEGEPDLKYCVEVYCQQGWDPARSPAVTLLDLTGKSSAARRNLEACRNPHRASGHPKRPQSEHGTK